MHQFFDIKNLTQTQQENWETAKNIYTKIASINVEKEFITLTYKEKIKLKARYKVKDDDQLRDKLYEFSRLMNNNGNEESALFARLLEGKKPLKFRPPTSFGQYWYSVIEENETIELTMFEDSLKINNFIKSNEINIYQNMWKVLKVISDKEALITFGSWEKMGFVWKFYLEKISCEKTTGFICAHHDSKIDRVTTLVQLEKEQMFHVKDRFSKINLVLDNDYAVKEKQLIIEKYGLGFGSGIFSSSLYAGQKLLAERRFQGLADYPTDVEIQIEVDKQVKRYFDRDITSDINGELYSFTWVLKRVSPVQIGSEIYMDI